MLEVTSYIHMYMIYEVICHMRGHREGAVEAACPQLWVRVDGAPKPSGRTEKLLLFYILFRFTIVIGVNTVVIGEKAKR